MNCETNERWSGGGNATPDGPVIRGRDSPWSSAELNQARPAVEGEAHQAAVHLMAPGAAWGGSEADRLEAELVQDPGRGPVAEEVAGADRSGAGLGKVPSED